MDAELKLPQGYSLQPYRAEFGLAIVRMWRASFQRAMGLAADNSWPAVEHQLAYLASMDTSNMSIVLHEPSSEVAAFYVADSAELHDLYVAVGHQGKGLGGQLLELSKRQCADSLELFVFADNTNARAFYRHHGFAEIATSHASMDDNPWADSEEQLRDVRCRWARSQS